MNDNEYMYCSQCQRPVWAHAPGCAKPDPTASWTQADHEQVKAQWEKLNAALNRLPRHEEGGDDGR